MNDRIKPIESSDNNEGFEALLRFLKESRGTDLTGYKDTTLRRRILKRMQANAVNTFTQYIEHLETHPEEFTQLFNTILINVTGFFRDSDSWDYLAQEIIPRILSSQRHEFEPIRVWSVGCSSGEEAYTLAMVLAEVLGIEAFRSRMKIYATDADNEALFQARQAVYRKEDLKAVPEPLVDKYFEQDQQRYTFRNDLRRLIIFGRHNLLHDDPISHLDLVVCRNTLMYFNAEAQARILEHFHFALKSSGFLFLGRAEMLLTHTGLFRPVNLRHRIFYQDIQQRCQEPL